MKGGRDFVKEEERDYRRHGFYSIKKTHFKDKVEQRICTGNAKQTWERLNVMTDRERTKQSVNMTETPTMEGMM